MAAFTPPVAVVELESKFHSASDVGTARLEGVPVALWLELAVLLAVLDGVRLGVPVLLIEAPGDRLTLGVGGRLEEGVPVVLALTLLVAVPLVLTLLVGERLLEGVLDGVPAEV